MYRRTLDEKIRRLLKEIEDGKKEVVWELLSIYKKFHKKKEYYELLSTIRPLKNHEILELVTTTWAEFFQQARICEAQNIIDESLLQEALAFTETDGLERVLLPQSGVICWHCIDTCADFDHDGERCKFTDVLRFIKHHKECVQKI